MMTNMKPFLPLPLVPRTLFLVFTLLGISLCFTPPVQAYVSPATGLPRAGTVLRAFDKPEHNWLAGHRGVDLALGVGADVLSAGGGVVAFVGTVVGTPTVSIDHPDGIRTTYQPVHGRVSMDEIVEEGQVIGSLGNPTTPYPGLQWGARFEDEYANPLGLLPAPTIRLKPLLTQ